MSVGPAGLQCITAHEIESDKFEALVGVTYMRPHNFTEHIRLAAATCARTSAPQQFEFQERFCAVIPRNGQFVSDLLDVRWLESHFRGFFFQGAGADLKIALSCSSLTKDCRADAYQRCALVNCDWKVICHAHRKLRQFHVEFRLERVAQFPNLHKKFPRVFRFHS